MASTSLAVLSSELDADSNLLNVANGTIELDTGTVRAHRREDLITKVSPVSFDPKADLNDNGVIDLVDLIRVINEVNRHNINVPFEPQDPDEGSSLESILDELALDLNARLQSVDKLQWNA